MFSVHSLLGTSTTHLPRQENARTIPKPCIMLGSVFVRGFKDKFLLALSSSLILSSLRSFELGYAQVNGKVS
jgi:hypothetical protein